MFDIIIAIAALLAFYRGWSKGLIAAVVSLIGVIVGAIFSLKLSYILADYLLQANIINSKLVMPVSFILVFVAIMLLCRFIIKTIEGALKVAMLGWANKLSGAILYCFFTLFFISSLLWLGTKVGLVNQLNDSKTSEYVMPIAPKAIEMSAAYIPFCKQILEEINNYASKVSKLA
jgi:membrane protein required for colicin V production